jgi:hypothetical protein
MSWVITGLCRYPDDPRDNYWDAQQWNSTLILTTRPPMQTLIGPDGLNPQLDAPAAVLDTALTTNGIMTTSGCPWPKATLKSPVGARDLGPL